MSKPSYFQNANERIIAWIISCAMFMESLDTTIINTAIPAMAHSFNVDPIDLKVSLISYLISLAIFIPISGWVADKFGSKQVFISSLWIFTLSSIWCGFAHNLSTLVCARILQGLGGSMMLPVGRLIILRTFGQKRLIIAMNKIVVVGIFGVMLGPVLGGFITSYWSWHWIFWVNIPFGIIAIFIAMRYFKPTQPEPVAALDTLGFILFGSGLAGFTFGLSTLSQSIVPQLESLIIIFIAIFLLIVYFFHSRKLKNPIIKTELFSFHTFRISILGNLLARIGFGGVPFLLPLLLQIGLGYQAALSGMITAPIALGVIASKQFIIQLLNYFGYKKLLILNTILVGLSLFCYMLVNKDTTIYMTGFLAFIFGILISTQYSAMNSLAYTEIPPPFLSAASSAMSTMQQLSQSFGVAVSALLLRYLAKAKSSAHYGLTTDVFHSTFFILGIMTLLSIFVFIKLKPGEGSQMLSQ